ncbi:hypothetical protein FGO68_gene5416 [Halteria grandinella]|uniref:Uncharacterized protein n=1 Tax=Halteria grandinella TaxID=5974 RepID=A0A8J8T989_HALGN|nr:hypothetical protein FGO68_gene5416 [Halteria grandinella]
MPKALIKSAGINWSFLTQGCLPPPLTIWRSQFLQASYLLMSLLVLMRITGLRVRLSFLMLMSSSPSSWNSGGISIKSSLYFLANAIALLSFLSLLSLAYFTILQNYRLSSSSFYFDSSYSAVYSLNCSQLQFPTSFFKSTRGWRFIYPSSSYWQDMSERSDLCFSASSKSSSSLVLSLSRVLTTSYPLKLLLCSSCAIFCISSALRIKVPNLRRYSLGSTSISSSFIEPILFHQLFLSVHESSTFLMSASLQALQQVFSLSERESKWARSLQRKASLFYSSSEDGGTVENNLV